MQLGFCFSERGGGGRTRCAGGLRERERARAKWREKERRTSIRQAGKDNTKDGIKISFKKVNYRLLNAGCVLIAQSERHNLAETVPLKSMPTGYGGSK